MAGSNKLLKEGELLFKQGDTSNGMYLVRKGEINVFLDKDGNEVSLAKISEGSMIGEMSLFDNKPRSASAKATAATEVTHITVDDFNKLMKQIPKWFVTLMGSLSTRLRQTNERLQGLENQKAGALPAFETVLRILHVLNLLWHKDGVKLDKIWTLNKNNTASALREIFKIDRDKIEIIFNALVDNEILQFQKDDYNNVCLAIRNKGNLEKFTKFCQDFIEKSPGRKCLSLSAIDLLKTLANLVKESSYEDVSIPFDDVCIEGERQSLDVSKWKQDLEFFKIPTEGIQLVKVSTGVGFKVSKAHLKSLIEYHSALTVLDKVKAA